MTSSAPLHCLELETLAEKIAKHRSLLAHAKTFVTSDGRIATTCALADCKRSQREMTRLAVRCAALRSPPLDE